ncbi:3-keto-5-aminohexanoate cleavage protein [Variovorax paradoxus]|nr:3-keto-5-aminohexanoate cleavage protein [Variovorax paradoxus]MBT2305092.1 3-keto-5-aminohexanoate cleavage protein [Variovorax paradoxus]
MSRPVIISCALTGGGDTASASPHVPVTPEQIAKEALAARAAGAAIVHIHVRDPETGKPSRDTALYREVVRRIRASGSDVLINLTTGAGGRYVPDVEDPNRNSVVHGMASPESRIEHVLELRPDICSLDLGTMNMSNFAFINYPQHVERMAQAIRAAGVKPELEVFDLGHAAYARHLCEKGLFSDPPWLQLCLGIPWGAPASVESLQAMRQMVPVGGCWSAFGISRHQFPMVAQAVLLGGHVRVGLEDNLYLKRGQLASGNGPMVERAARIVRELDTEVATPAQAREILRIG